MSKLLGLILLVLGGIAIFAGTDSSEGLSTFFTDTFGLPPAENAMVLYGAGGVAALLGLILLMKKDGGGQKKKG